MTEILSLIAEQEKKFEKFYFDELTFDMYDDGQPIVKAQFYETKEAIKSFHRSTLIAILEAQVERLKAQMKNQLLPVTRKMSRKSSKQLQRESYNAALETEIQTYQEVIDNLKK